LAIFSKVELSYLGAAKCVII